MQPQLLSAVNRLRICHGWQCRATQSVFEHLCDAGRVGTKRRPARNFSVLRSPDNRQRHCWVLLSGTEPVPCAGLLLEWKKNAAGEWLARVILHPTGRARGLRRSLGQCPAPSFSRPMTRSNTPLALSGMSVFDCRSSAIRPGCLATVGAHYGYRPPRWFDKNAAAEWLPQGGDYLSVLRERRDDTSHPAIHRNRLDDRGRR